jgi:NAD+ synthase (glutamine-hydrolysing)
MATKKQTNEFGFIKVAAVSPPLRVVDIAYNVSQVLKFARQAEKMGSQITVFPELCITGYTAGDLFHQRLLLEEAKQALARIIAESKTISSILVVGLPLALEGKIFNVAAVVGGGNLYGFVPKTYIPGYKEFYEERWFASSRDLTVPEIEIFGNIVPVGPDILFQTKEMPQAILGLEICEDLWTPVPPSSYQVLAGATIVANLSASNDLVGKADYRKQLVLQQSARGICGYVYASCGVHESTTDLVFGGHSIIAENGSLLKESERFSRDGEITVAEIDTEHLMIDRERTTSFGESVHESFREFRFVEISLPASKKAEFIRHIDAHPFVPQNPQERDKRAKEIFSIQASGLAKRLDQAGLKRMIIGLSGGLDSTLAILVAVEVTKLLKLPRRSVYAYTMPGFATSNRTKSNAEKLAHALGVTFETIDITDGCISQLKDVHHDTKTQDLTFQNAQARYRTMTLMNKANQIGGIVVGTGDLSEIALGWNTFTGDQISHYNVNAGIPKTLVKYLVKWVSEKEEFSSAADVLEDILATPISPELVRAGQKEITQKTEDLIGPYELHDLFLFHFVRWGSSPKKILFLAEHAFKGKYTSEVIKKWLKNFITRFFHNQWKRSVMPDGPKVGSVALSPRGDWRMPSDAEVELWIKELK